MNRGKIEAKKPGKKLTTGQVVKTIGKTAGILLAAGIALIAAIPAIKNLVETLDGDEKSITEAKEVLDKVEAPDAPDAEQKEVK